MSDKSHVLEEAAKLREIYDLRKCEAKKEGRFFGQKLIAKAGNWSQPNVSAYLKGVVELKEDSALVFSSALNVPVSAFSPRVAALITQREALARNPSLGKTAITFVPRLTAEQLYKIRHDLTRTDFIMPHTSHTTPISKELSSHAFGFQLADKSLESKFVEGTEFVFEPGLKPVPTDFVCVAHKVRPNDIHIRKYAVTAIKDDGTESYKLQALNPSYPDLGEDYEVIGVAVAVVNMLK